MRLIVIEPHESQRRKLANLLDELSKKGYTLTVKIETPPSGGWSEIIAASRSGGLFENKRITVIESAEELGTFPVTLAYLLREENEENNKENNKEDLKKENADSILIAVFGNDSKNVPKFFPIPKEILKKITFIKSDASVPPWKRKEWLMSLAKETSCKLNLDAATLLTESIESQEELRGELEKLALYAADETITIEMVRQLSFDEGGNSLLRFLDGVCQNRITDVLVSLRHLQAEPSPLPLLTALYNRLRPAMYIACFSSESSTPSTSEAIQNKILKVIGTKEYALRMSKTALNSFGKNNIKRFMFDLIRLSYFEKTSFAEGWFGFEVALWRFMSKK